MTELLLRVLIFVFISAAVVAVAVIVRNARRGPGLATFFAPKPAKRRIDIVEQAAIDAKRRLILVRRDDVEHLVMTGGPVDIVIETGIGARSNSGERTAASTPTLPPRALGQAAE